MPVRYFTEDLSFDLKGKRAHSQWIVTIIKNENQDPGNINYIFCSDPYLHSINRQYLNHDTYTDIITFDQSEENNLIEGEIYISIDRVKENASSLNVPFETELRRVMAHGVLHLLGYTDKDPEHKKTMRKKEDDCLRLLI